ncbi:hypothetical protein ACUXOQ_001734 [Dermabacter hominis]
MTIQKLNKKFNVPAKKIGINKQTHY